MEKFGDLCVSRSLGGSGLGAVFERGVALMWICGYCSVSVRREPI